MKRWKVPLADIDLGRPEIDAVTSVLRSRWLTMGPVTREFEEAFARTLGVSFCFAVSNGTAALHLACLAAGLGPGDEAVCPSLSFVATANAVHYTGARPVFADIRSLDDWTIDPADIERKITPKTRAIVVMHYGGYPCAMKEIMTLARRRGLAVIEDAAHAAGSEYRGRPCGAIGDIGCFSFFSNKNMTTGEGGMVATDDAEFARRIRLARSHGMTSLSWDRHEGARWSYDVVGPGYNYRLDDLRSALGLVQLRRLPAANRRRARLTDRYRVLLGGRGDLSLPFGRRRGSFAHHLLPALVGPAVDRGRVLDGLAAQGVQASVHYPPIHHFSWFQRRSRPAGRLPLTEEVGRRALTLPLFSAMTVCDVATVAAALARALDRARHGYG